MSYIKGNSSIVFYQHRQKFVKKCVGRYLLWQIIIQLNYDSEPAAQRCSVKKVFLKVSQNSQENTCARVSFLTKMQVSAKRLWHRYFPVNFVKILRTRFLTEHLRWLLLLNEVMEKVNKQRLQISVKPRMLESLAKLSNIFGETELIRQVKHFVSFMDLFKF